MESLVLIILIIVATGWVLYQRRNLLTWTAIVGIVLLVLSFIHTSPVTLFIFWILYFLIAIIFNIKPLRCILLSRKIFSIYKKIMPPMSATEKEALDAGCVTWEADLFSGKPDWQKLLAVPAAKLTSEEQAFLDGPTEELCSMICDWEITHKLGDMPPEMWQFIKDKGFFSFIIPKNYGGLAFSPFAISRILVKLYSCSITVATTVGVPNSLGPAELLLKYGTEEQKDHYLPKLANGEEVPCFALTGPTAGSDASSLPDTGIVCKAEFEGKETLGIKLNFDKRYITLAPIATLVGLAFKLYDPDHLVGNVEDYGVTCALIPRETTGIEIGRRHFPVNQAFMNGPVRGKNVFIPLDWIIGGKDMAGKGWRMLMACLAEGRAVTLPSSSLGGAVGCVHATGAYAHIRQQFNTSIAQFGGVEEMMARIGGNTYLMDAGMRLTFDHMNIKQKSAIAAAIVKYHVTERGREVVNDAMDIHGGKGVMLGAKNYLARGYEGVPIAITVEGANILTRCLIIFGQGVVRCHPYVMSEMLAVQDNNLAAFDTVFWGHIGYFLSNFCRTFWLGLTNARFVKTPVQDKSKRYYQILTRYSSALALFSDMAMFTLGGSLKRREKISARLGDVLSNLYMGSGVLKRFQDEGAYAEDLPLVSWASRDLIYQNQEALHNLLRNFPNTLLAKLLRFTIFPFGRLFSRPLDRYGKNIAQIMLFPSKARERLTAGAYIPDDVTHNMGLLKITLDKVIAADPLIKRINKAYKQGMIKGNTFTQRIAAAMEAGLISDAEETQLYEMQKLRHEVIAVDDFASDELMG